MPGRGAGAYRSATRARACSACGISLVRAADLGSDVSLLRSPAVRASETLHERCPDCDTRLARITLEWDGAGRTRIEVCSHCALMVFDPSELSITITILDHARALPPDAIERLLELAPDVDDDEVERLRR